MRTKIRAGGPTGEVDNDESNRIAPAPERPARFDSPPSFLEKPDPAEAPSAAPLERSNLQIYLQEIGKTALLRDGMIHIQAGGGVVADSDPAAEYQETINKAGALIKSAEIASRF